MQSQTVLEIIGIAIIALLVALFQYYVKAKRTSKKTVLFAFLRFLGVFIVLLLLLNPKITVTKTHIEKPDLILLADQSKSIGYLNQQEVLLKSLKSLKENKAISDRFDISVYSFGEELSDSIDIEFKAGQTKISNSLKNIQKVHRKPQSPIVLLTDGNQTYGADYAYYKSEHQQPIYAIPLGDTTEVADFRIKRLNVNKYAYLNNSFPVEVLVSYVGKTPKKTQFVVYKGNQVVFKKAISLSATNSSEFIEFNIKATQPGTHTYSAKILPFKEEKNKENNYRNFVVETIDQKTNILLVSAIKHPDIAALKRCVESNERRKLTVVKPTEVRDLDEYQMLILYQPQASFKTVYELADKKGIQLFTITGTNTDWRFLNSLKRNYQKEINYQTEEIIPVLSTNFEIFNTDGFNFKDYPPVENSFGRELLSGSYETLLYNQIASVNTEDPLLAIWSTNGKSEAVLFGSGFWKWRLANYKRDDNFEKFDNFFGKIIQYLSSKKQRKRLEASYESTYYINNPVKISASYFNKNYEFDTKGNLLLSVTETTTKSIKKVPMVLKGTFYEADLSDLTPGNYQFSVKVKNTKLVISGGFSLIDFDIEKQIFTPDVERLSAVSQQSNGALFYPNQIKDLITQLTKDIRFTSVQKSKKENVPLVSWKWMLSLLLLLFGAEWFLRKYNGLI